MDPKPHALEAALPWAVKNLLRLGALLVLASVTSAPLVPIWGPGLFDSEVPAPTLDEAFILAWFLFNYGGLWALPGLAVWLAFLARIPADGPRSTRRAAAVVTSPLVGLGSLVWLSEQEAYVAALIFGVFWPLLAGFIVRLRERAPTGDAGSRI